MNNNHRKSLIAVAVAAMISAPAWSATDTAVSSTDEKQSRGTQTQNAVSSSDDTRSVTGVVRARASGNLLYSRTPDELTGMEVIGSDDEPIGKIKTVVMDRSRNDVHAVISSGGIMGIGSREILLPIAQLEQVENDKIQSQLTREAARARPEFQKEHYGVLETNRHISDFSAFEPTMSAADQADHRVASGMAVNPLHLLTPEDMHGMEVVGSDRESIGQVRAILGSSKRDEVHVVVSTGGFLGLDAREILIPLNEMRLIADKTLQVGFNQVSVEARPQYHSPEFGELELKRPISEFFAFNPLRGADGSVFSSR